MVNKNHMPTILNIESSSKNCSVSISNGADILCLCEEYDVDYQHSEKLHTFVQWALEGASLTLQDLDAVALGSGAGSYTGLRIGAASAKGFCYALGLPLLAYHSMWSMVKPFVNQGFDYIFPMIDARRKEVYTGSFSGDGEELSAMKALVLEEKSLELFFEKKVLVIGDGAQKCEQILGASWDYRPWVYPSAGHMAERSCLHFRAEKWEDLAYFDPLYLKEWGG